jgi:HlyD family secretion protein
MRFPLRLVIAVIVVAAVILLAWLVFRRDKGPSSVTETHAVGRGTIEQTVQGTGVLESATSATIVSKVAGRLGEPLVKEGDQVEADQVLMHIDNDEIESLVKLKQAEITKLEERLDEVSKPVEERSDVKKAKAAWDRAKLEYDRKKRALDDELALGEATTLSERELADLKEDVDSLERETGLAEDAYEEAKKAITEGDKHEAEENVAQAKLDLEDLQKQADGREVRSPIKGTVLKVEIEPETLAVDPDKEYPEETPLFVVADLGSLFVRGHIYQSDEAKLDRNRINAPGLPESERVKARVQLAGLGRTLDGDVTYLSLTPEESASGVRQFEVKITFPTPPTGVTDGLRVSFDIVVKRVENVVVVPVRFVELDGPRAFVQKLVGGRPVRTQVRLGVSDNDSYQVLEGLREGDVIRWESTGK